MGEAAVIDLRSNLYSLFNTLNLTVSALRSRRIRGLRAIRLADPVGTGGSSFKAGSDFKVGYWMTAIVNWTLA
jgi:hypothetical protein